MNSEILSKIKGKLAIITLNRPEALNALSDSMIAELSRLFDEYESDDRVQSVVLCGAGDRAFCAGGDVRVVVEEAMAAENPQDAARFFAAEYRLNMQMHDFKKPIIAIMKGITMGGGFGLAGNADYRIAMSGSRFAMPEVGIGFFPDVGAVQHLRRICGEAMGRYLALSGAIIDAADMVHTKIATHFVGDIDESELIDKLQDGDLGALPVSDVKGSLLAENQAVIENAFSHVQVTDIMSALENSHAPWAGEVCVAMRSKSALSQLITAQHYAQAAEQEFEQVIERDFILARYFLQSPEFHEGVSAALIRKDRNPVWQYDSIEDVPTDEVGRAFDFNARDNEGAKLRDAFI